MMEPMKTPPLTIRKPIPIVSKPTITESNDRLLALVLAVLLMKNNASAELVMALLYLAI